MTDALNLGALLGSAGGVGLGGLLGSTAGVGGTASGGLFGALLGVADGALSADGITAPTALPLDWSSFLPQFSTMLQAGEQPLQVQGEMAAVQVLVTRITILTEQLTVQGGFQFGAKGATGDLASALTKLGLPAAEAEALATRIDTMLELLRQQAGLAKEDLAGETGTGLAALLLAAMLNPAQAQTLQLPETDTTTITAVQVQVVQTQVTINVASWQAVKARAQGIPSVTNAAPITAEISAAPVANQGGVQVVATVQAEASPVVVSAETPLETPVPAAPQLSVALPILANATQPNSNANKRAAPMSGTVETVAAPTPLQGTVLYKLTETQPNNPVLQAVQQGPANVITSEAAPITDETPRVEALEPLPAPQATPAAGVTEAAALSTTERPSAVAALAERVYQAQTAHVGQQVQIAIQPLLRNPEGGAVRMTLNPPELGKLEVHLKIENGQVHGTIAAQDNGVVEHLARELPALRQSLQDAGLKLGEQGLSLMLSNQQQPDQQPGQNPFASLAEERGQRQQGGQTPEFGMSSAENTSITTTASRWVSPTQLVDVAA